jgi:hypothetical protein
MLAFGVVHVIRRNRQHATVKAPVLSDTTLIRACLKEIGRLQTEVMRGGWTPERTGAALTAIRIGTAVAIGRPVSQVTVDMTAPGRQGQLSVGKGIFKRERMVVSAPITPDVIERYRMNGNGQVTNVRTKAMIDELGKSLAAFTAVRYGRNGSVDVPALNRMLEKTRMAMKHLLVRTLWPMRTAGTLFQSANMLRASWTR